MKKTVMVRCEKCSCGMVAREVELPLYFHSAEELAPGGYTLERWGWWSGDDLVEIEREPADEGEQWVVEKTLNWTPSHESFLQKRINNTATAEDFRAAVARMRAFLAEVDVVGSKTDG